MSEDRLLRALEADGVRREALYTLAVTRKIERIRWLRKARIDVARGVALGVTTAGVVLAFASWTPRLEYFEAVLSVAMAVFAVLSATSILGRRVE